LLLWSSCLGPHEGPEYQNQSEIHFEHLTPDMNKARNETVFPLDDITGAASKKPKVRKNENDNSVSSSAPSIPNSQGLLLLICISHPIYLSCKIFKLQLTLVIIMLFRNYCQIL
jgi:hypothetical protein